MGIRHRIFYLVNPPTDDQADLAVAVIDEIDFDWRRCLPELRLEGDTAVHVRWVEQRQGVAGTYHRRTNHIELDPGTPTYSSSGEAYTLAHEIGHMVDDTTLSRRQQDQLAALMHEPPFVQIGHFDHDHPDADHVERWVSRVSDDNPYTARLNEAFADLFVMTFAPRLWSGEFDGRRHWPRFVHHTDDGDAVREIVMADQEPMFADVPAGGTHARNIEDLAVLGVVDGADRDHFRPGRFVTRAQVASMIAEALDHAAPGWRPDGT